MHYNVFYNIIIHIQYIKLHNVIYEYGHYVLMNNNIDKCLICISKLTTGFLSTRLLGAQPSILKQHYRENQPAI